MRMEHGASAVAISYSLARATFGRAKLRLVRLAFNIAARSSRFTTSVSPLTHSCTQFKPAPTE